MQVVYTGVVKKGVIELIQVEEDGTLGKEYWFAQKIATGRTIGIIYDMDINDKSQISNWRSYNYIGRWKNDSLVMEWNARSKAITDSDKLVREMTKKEEDYCKGLNEIYIRLPYNSRTAFLARIIKIVIGN